MATPITQSKKPLGQILLETGEIDPVLLEAALSHQREGGERLGRILVGSGFVDEEKLARALALQYGLPSVRLDQVSVRPEALRTVAVDLAERFTVLPLKLSRRHRMLKVATAEPSDQRALQTLAHHTGMRISLMVSGEDAISKAIQRYYHGVAPSQLTLDPTGPSAVNLCFEWPEGPSPAEQRLATHFAQMTQYVATLERAVKEQSFAIRGMLEILDQRGLVKRDELSARLKDTSRPPPMPLPSRRKQRRLLLPELPPAPPDDAFD
jgi:hypothetical protein